MAFNIIDFANISLVIAFLSGLAYCLYAVIDLRSTIVGMSGWNNNITAKMNAAKYKIDEKIQELSKEILSQKSKIDEIKSTIAFIKENEVKQKKKQ